MNLRFDKVIRSVGFGFRKVYSLVLSDEGLYLIRTGSVGTLKHYRVDANRQIAVLNEDDRGVKEIQNNEGRIDSVPLANLVKESDNFVIRPEAIEEVKIKAGQSPEMLIEVTGSDHYLVFPYASFEEVETLQRALNKWSVKK